MEHDSNHMILPHEMLMALHLVPGAATPPAIAEGVATMIWSELTRQEWHYYNFTSESSVWECRPDPDNLVVALFRGGSIERLTITISTAESEWSRRLEILMNDLVEAYHLVKKPGPPEG
ncbi:hypothetical protein TA3x_000089 [Tundrisphaera sp. TA3]|uniref:hypothetical protein n=1 Tax=Tundrisphaera sp. TA3 TaxID=3435775 RepID=UPI003EBCEBAE